MKKLVCCIFASAFLFGCTNMSAPVMPPSGLIYQNISAPLDVDMEETKAPSKSGRASSYSILWLFAWGDCSIATAAKDGDIKIIETADYEYTNFLGIYQSFTLVAHGE